MFALLMGVLTVLVSLTATLYYYNVPYVLAHW